MSESPNLFFEFVGETGEKQPLTFHNPVRILQAFTIEEIPNVFSQIEEATQDGYYVAGYVAYEAAPAFDQAFSVHPQQNELPLVWFGVFDEPVKRPLSNHEHFSVSEWKVESTFETYQENMDTIKKAIEIGDTYQINYTTRMKGSVTGDRYSFYQYLSKNQQSSYSAYLQIGDYSILSASPELFFRKHGQTITTKPMKGTSERGRWLREDEQFANELYHSEKNRAENVMIVDLLRNDLGRIAIPGSVRVPKLFDIETYPTVHQMTSTIQADVGEDVSIYKIFEALFPCGSITGAPKIRTMEYIAKLEDSPREVYCGAIGYITPEKDAVFNVPIRTVWVNHQTTEAVYGTGGGITWDSTSKGEYDELLTKAKLLTEKRPAFKLLETMRLSEGSFPLKLRHLNRLKRSCVYFKRVLSIEDVHHHLNQLEQEYPHGELKVRLLVNEEGRIETEVAPNSYKKVVQQGALAEQPINSSDPFLFHKTTHREVYHQHQNHDLENPNLVLLWNERDELTEFIIGNVVVELNGELLTPPIESGLLAGTFREELLEEGTIKEKKIRKEDLKKCEKIWMINALRSWVEMKLI